MGRRARIGELLARHGHITAEQLAMALRQQQITGRKIGSVLTELGYIREEQLLSVLAQQFQVPFVDLRKRDLDPEVVALLPEAHARRLRTLVIEDQSKHLLVGIPDPSDIFALDEIAHLLKRQVRPALVSDIDLQEALDRYYRGTEGISALAVELSDDLSSSSGDTASLEVDDRDSDAPVVRLLQSLFNDAAKQGASDLHIEPGNDVLRIRMRVDGVLQEQRIQDTSIAPALLLRLKIMSGLDISERRLPQDGRFNIQVAQRRFDVRLSTMPIQAGESAVLRLLDQSGEMFGLERLGMPPRILKRIQQMILLPHGLLVVTGPTGSGKTTTLYSMLRELNTESKKIITVEDPVEYRIERINQVQVKPKINLTFASVLRSALRQDPDVIMVGEIRDQETAEIALRAAMTGHLVFSTLHTNSAIQSSLRLLDMGAAGYLVAAALKGVLAQRLVRRICDGCREAYAPDAQEQAWLLAVVGPRAPELKLQAGRGCRSCNGSGYRGRIGIHELLVLDPAMADALRRGDSAAFAAAARANREFRSLTQCALEFAAQGVTSLAEVFRISEQVEDSAGPQPAQAAR